MYFRQIIGKYGEDLACNYLKDNNYKLYYLKYNLNNILDNILYKWKRGNNDE